MIWYNENNSEMKTDSATAKDRHVINSSPLVDTKYENIWSVFGQLILGIDILFYDAIFGMLNLYKLTLKM